MYCYDDSTMLNLQMPDCLVAPNAGENPCLEEATTGRQYQSIAVKGIIVTHACSSHTNAFSWHCTLMSDLALLAEAWSCRLVCRLIACIIEPLQLKSCLLECTL